MKKNIAVFASGTGSNFSAINQAVKTGVLKGACLKLLVCDNPEALVLEKAAKAEVKILLAERKNFSSQEAFENEIIRHLKDDRIDLVVLAGFMRILSDSFVRAYRNRIINIHPSLLPSFKGGHGIKDAFDYGVKLTGVTVHFVDEEMDHGPIILQSAIEIKRADTLASLEKKIHQAEHKIYPQAIKLFLSGKLKVNGRKVKTL